MQTMTIRPGLDVDRDELASFCRRHHITRLALFGSVLRDDFTPASDIDVLVEYEPGQTPSYFKSVDVEQELSDLFSGRQIDLGTRGSLHRWIKDRVLRELRVLYDAA